MNEKAIVRKFKAWLESSSAEPFILQTGEHESSKIRLIHFPSEVENVDFLISLPPDLYYDKAALYAGIYNRETGRVYDAVFPLRELAKSSEVFSSLVQVSSPTKDVIDKAIGDAVTRIIDNDRNRLGAESTQPCSDDATARDTAERLFLDNEEQLTGIPYSCKYRMKRYLTENEWISCLIDFPKFADEQAEQYISENKEKIMREFLFNDMVWKHYQDIVQNSANSTLHIVKKIRWAVKHAEAKTVKVTIRKGVIEDTFKTDAKVFLLNRRNYTEYDMAAADRQRYKLLFGGSISYYPNEIIRITYGKNTLYEKCE